MINVGRKNLDVGEEPYIIAEIGSNFTNIKDCIEAIKASRRVEADCVKFQIFEFKSLYGLQPDMIPSWYNKKAELKLDWLPQLKETANDVGIDLMFSCFSPDMPRYIDPYVSAHKIASSEITNLDLLEEVASLGKPIFLSTGGATERDINSALSILEGCKIIINYCVAAYPAHNINLYKLDIIKELGHHVGFSDHTKDSTYLPLSAVKNHSAVAIEKHFNPCNVVSADAGHSLNEGEFANMVAYLKGRKEANIGPTAEELDMIYRAQKRLVATAKIKKGQVLSYGDNFGPYRSLTPDRDGITPFCKDMFDGKTAKRDIMPGKGISNLDI